MTTILALSYRHSLSSPCKPRLGWSSTAILQSTIYNNNHSNRYGSSKRYVSSTIIFTAIDRSPSIPMGTIKSNKIGKLRVPLLKSPSHLGHFTSRMSRLYNEDKYSANVLTLQSETGERTLFNFNIFDGHGGEQCSTFLSQHLSENIENCQSLLDDKNLRNELIKNYETNIGGYWKRWFRHKEENFKTMKNKDDNIKLSRFNNSEKNEKGEIINIDDDLRFRLPLTFLNTDYEFFNQDDNSAGSTCTSAIIETLYTEPGGEPKPVFENYYFNRKTISKLTIAHVGDTKAILVDRNGLANALTFEHHPSNPMEASRLRKYAANMFMTDSFGEERFISLANTRSFGDINFKQIGVSAEPDVIQLIIGDVNTVHKMLTPDEIKDYTINGIGGDESFLVLCTDGITNFLTDQEIADIVMVNFNMRGHQVANPQLCAEEIIKFVEYIGGDDNATCLVIRLNGWGKWPVLDRTGELRQSRMDDFNPRGRSG
ncbi:phosphatase 2C-like domain-containing protein [Scheffersomyces coipomensis]|uniref:phosphatase 2C-like domain-containing protein n=1 Tax=Scheffersomyces coipomensis TaxID=1788519 RepID=UPI00315DC40E